MEATELPFTAWLLAMYLMTQTKNGISALELSRQVGVVCNALWRLKHKPIQVMKELDDSRPSLGFVQMDDAYLGGEKHGGKRGRCSENKHPFVAAVQTDKENHPLYMRFSMVTSFRKKELKLWAKMHRGDQTECVVSDGLRAFTGITDAGQPHKVVVTGGGHESMTNELFTWVKTMISNVKTPLKGSYHSFNPQHLPRYLAEFSYRFNRRFDLICKRWFQDLVICQRARSQCQKGFLSWLTHSGNQEKLLSFSSKFAMELF